MNYQFRNSLIFADSVVYSATAGLGERAYQFNIRGILSGRYRQSVKFDFGSVISGDQTKIPRLWECTAAIPMTNSGTGEISIFVGFSDSPVSGVGNPAGLSGVDGEWHGYGTTPSDADEVVDSLMSIGSQDPPVTVTNDQILQFGVFSPKARYGILVVKNGLSVALPNLNTRTSLRLKPIYELKG